VTQGEQDDREDKAERGQGEVPGSTSRIKVCQGERGATGRDMMLSVEHSCH